MKILFYLLFCLFVGGSGIETALMPMPDEFGQRAYVTWRKDDPYAMNILRDSVFLRDNLIRMVPLDVNCLDEALLNSLSKREISELASLFKAEEDKGRINMNYDKILPFQLKFLFIINEEGGIESIILKYPDIPEYRKIKQSHWRRLERLIRKRVSFSAPGEQVRCVLPYTLDWFADLEDYVLTGNPVNHYRRSDSLQ